MNRCILSLLVALLFPSCASAQIISAYGDSITASTYYLGGFPCAQPDWPCGVVDYTAADFGVASERIAEGTARLIADLDAGSVPGDFVSLAWGTNDLQSAVFPAVQPPCPDVEACFISQLRLAGQKALDEGIVPVLVVPIPWRVSDPFWDNEGGCIEGRGCVTEGGSRAYIRDVLKPALVILSAELGDYDPPGPLAPQARAIPLADAFSRFVELEPDMILYYRDVIHPTRMTDPPGPDGRTGAQVIADEVEAVVTDWLWPRTGPYYCGLGAELALLLPPLLWLYQGRPRSRQ